MMARTYRDDLLFALRMRDVPGPRIAEALAEVDSHVTESGEDPREAFGPPDKYADQVCEALGAPSERWSSSDTLIALVSGLGVGGGTWLLFNGLFAWGTSSGLLGLPAWLIVLAGLGLLALTVVALRRAGLRWQDPVTDPRDGSDMVGASPWWVPPMLFAPPLLAVVLVVVMRLAD